MCYPPSRAVEEYEEYEKAIEKSNRDTDEPEPNYEHPPCGTKKYIEGAHKVTEYAWCEEAEAVVSFKRIE